MNPRAAGQKLTQRQKPLLFQSLQAPSLSLVPAHPRLFHLLCCQAEPQRLGSLQPQKPPLPRGVSPRRTRPCKATRSSLLTGREAEALSDHPASSRAESPTWPDSLLQKLQLSGRPTVWGAWGEGLPHRHNQSRGFSSSCSLAQMQPPAWPAPTSLPRAQCPWLQRLGPGDSRHSVNQG